MKNPKAFTLIEMLVVLCLCMIIASFGMLQLSFLDSTLAHIELDKIAAVCSYLQQKALITNEEQVLHCDIQAHEYISDTIREKIASPISFGVLPNVYKSTTSRNPLSKPITFAKSAIHFYPTGIISSGALYLINNKKTTMYALTNAVSQVSYLRFYRYDGNWKLLNK